MRGIIRLVALLSMLALLSSSVLARAAEGPAPAEEDTHPKLVVPMAGYGFADGMSILDLSPADLERELDAVAMTGARWLRVPMNWSRIETVPGRLDWTDVNRVVRSARRHHLTVLGDLAYSPAWARPLSSHPTAPPALASAYARFAATTVRHFRAAVTHWEIWNEPNLSKFFGGGATHASAPETYTRLLRAAYPAIKRVQPHSVVVAGALSASLESATSSDSIGPTEFVSRMYAAGAHGYFDALSLHPYVLFHQGRPDTAGVYAGVTRVRRLMTQHGDQRRKIWFTELGNSTWSGGPDQDEQLEMLLAQLAQAALRWYVGPTFLYSIRDTGTNPLIAAQHFGTLLTRTWEPKSLAQVLDSLSSPDRASRTDR